MNDKTSDTRMAPGVPIDQAYWVVPQKLLAGCYPGSENDQQAHRQLQGLLIHGIRQVINLMESDEFNWYGRIRQNSPIRHRTSPETPEQLDFVQSWVQGE